MVCALDVFRLVALAGLALVLDCTYALKVDTPDKWNVNVANILIWQPEEGDPKQVSVVLRHPTYLPRPGIAIISAAYTVDAAALVWIPALKTSDLYRVQVVSVENTNDALAESNNFTIVTDDSPAEHYTYTFLHPQNIQPSPTASSSGSQSQPSSADSPSPIAPATSATPSLSYNGAAARRRAPRLWALLLSQCLPLWWFLVAR